MTAVDVLAVLCAAESVLRREGYKGTPADLVEARAAVVELVEQAKAPAVAYGCLSPTGVHFVSDDRGDCVEESRRDGSLVVELIVRPRALTRVQGGAS